MDLDSTVFCGVSTRDIRGTNSWYQSAAKKGSSAILMYVNENWLR